MKLLSSDKHKYRILLLKTFAAFSRFCNENDIHFCAAGGTMLGAVRHNGMIPWDDDIDVYMMRADYDRFISLRELLSNTEYEVVDLHTDGYYSSHAKFSHKYSSIWEFQGIPFVLGAFVDVFVLDYESGDYGKIKKKRQQYTRLDNLYFICSNNLPIIKLLSLVRHFNFIKTIWYLCQKLLFFVIGPHIRKQLLKHNGNTKGEWLVAYTGTSGSKDIFRSEWFDRYIPFSFEDTTIDVPIGYVAYLSAMYGDYLSFPPVEKRQSHHSLFYYNLNRRITIEEVTKMQME